MSDYILTVGIEVHAEMNTNTKAFCSCANMYGAKPNTLVCPMCLGLPGSIPSINRSAVEKTIATALMFDGEISSSTRFERKNYFYYDLPKGYQIVQYNMPISTGGQITLSTGKVVDVDRIHMEEDTAKVVYGDNGETYLDFNRSGVPIVEIVCKPTVMTCEEIVESVQTIRQNLLYAGVSNCRLERGELRFDINMSLSNSPNKLGTRVELINLTSASDISKAVSYEIERQKSILDEGGEVSQETRCYSRERNETYEYRRKENVRDYRHVTDPDLREIKITQQDIKKIRKLLPESLRSRVLRYEVMGLEKNIIDIITADFQLSNYFDEVVCMENNPVEVSNWVVGDLLNISKEMNSSQLSNLIKPQELAKIINLLTTGQISRHNAKVILKEAVVTGKTATLIAREYSMLGVVSDKDHWAVVDEILETNPAVVEDYKNNPEKVINHFVGEALELSGGRVDIETIKRMLKEKLDCL